MSIDGQRTYFDVAPTQAPYNRPNRPQRPQNPTPAGKGSIVGATKYLGGRKVFQPTKSSKYAGQIVGSPLPVEPVDIDRNVKPYVPIAKRKPTPSVSRVASTTPRVQNIPTRGTRLPPAPPVRIDTCIVGNDATCGQHEICKTYLGVSSCYCKPGYGRKNHRMLCKSKLKSLVASNPKWTLDIGHLFYQWWKRDFVKNMRIVFKMMKLSFSRNGSVADVHED